MNKLTMSDFALLRDSSDCGHDSRWVSHIFKIPVNMHLVMQLYFFELIIFGCVPVDVILERELLTFVEPSFCSLEILLKCSKSYVVV